MKKKIMVGVTAVLGLSLFTFSIVAMGMDYRSLSMIIGFFAGLGALLILIFGNMFGL